MTEAFFPGIEAIHAKLGAPFFTFRLEPRPRSGRQEMPENLLNRYRD